jgi:hypothetical protein
LGSLSARLRRLEREAEEEMIVISQFDGTVKKFPRAAGIDAYMNWFDRLGAGEGAPPEHPLLVAVRNTSDPWWQGSVYYANDPDEWTKPIPDLSE